MFIRKESEMALSFFEKSRNEKTKYHGMKNRTLTNSIKLGANKIMVTHQYDKNDVYIKI